MPAATTARADVVVAVHDPTRPIERAVRSVLADGLPGVRAVVVAHNLPAATIADRLAAHGVENPRVVLLELHDGIRSPAGPFTAGLDASDAPHVAVLGSDDYLDPGALTGWLARAHAGAEAVMARVRHQNGGLVRTPAPRIGRTRRLDLVRDRLAYRTAPLGLLDRAMLRRVGARFLAGVPTGEDLEFGLRVWHGATNVEYATGPGYVIGADAQQRVTTTRRPVAELFAAHLALVDGAWFASLDAAARRAVVVKLIRVHLFGAIPADGPPWLDGERAALADIAARLVAAAPDAVGAFSRSESALWGAVTQPRLPDAVLHALSRERRRHGMPGTLLGSSIAATVDAQAPLRLMAASLALR